MGAQNRKPESEDLDRWLDIGLRGRANAEPRSGLEQRVLARLAAEPPKQQFAWWQLWAAAAAIFVIVLTLSLVYPQRRDQVVNEQPRTVSPEHKTRPNGPTTQQRQLPTAGVASGRGAACCVSKRLAAKYKPPAVQTEREALPKLASFPAPRPETKQERLLAELAGQQETVEVASISRDAAPLKELSIPELKIDPMEGTPSDNVQRDQFGRKDASQERR